MQCVCVYVGDSRRQNRISDALELDRQAMKQNSCYLEEHQVL